MFIGRGRHSPTNHHEGHTTTMAINDIGLGPIVNLTVDNVSLETVVGQTVEYDEDGDACATGGVLVADLVADRLVEKIVGSESYPKFKGRVLQMRDEMVRERLAPEIEKALTGPIQTVNQWGEPNGKVTDLRELIMEEAKKLFQDPKRDAYSRQKPSWITELIESQVKAAFVAEVAALVAEAKKAVSAEVGKTVADQIGATVAKALAGR